MAEPFLPPEMAEKIKAAAKGMPLTCEMIDRLTLPAEPSCHDCAHRYEDDCGDRPKYPACFVSKVEPTQRPTHSHDREGREYIYADDPRLKDNCGTITVKGVDIVMDEPPEEE